MHISKEFLLSLLTFGYAPSIGASSSDKGTHLTAWESIHQTLHTYPLAVDFKQPALYAAVFADDAFANYTGFLSNLTGLNAISTGLQASVASLISQHMLGTTLIDIENSTFAKSSTYFTANLFGTGSAAGSYIYLYGLYQDTLTKIPAVGWRIKTRYLVFMAPSIGNLSLTG